MRVEIFWLMFRTIILRLISLNGRPPSNPLSYDLYVKWKEQNKYQDYDYKKYTTPGEASNYKEIITMGVDTFEKWKNPI